MTQTKAEVDDAYNLAQSVYNEASEAKNASEERKAALEELETSIMEFLESSGSTPNDIRTLAQEVT